jgi:hypothetical protein
VDVLCVGEGREEDEGWQEAGAHESQVSG